jgi:hypothetical protein
MRQGGTFAPSKQKVRYLAQPTLGGAWWVLKIKGGRRPVVVQQNMTEDDARTLVESLNPKEPA